MSTVPEGNHHDLASSHVGHPPGAFALLTATALGSLVASRLPKAPLVVAAGITALALLKQKKAAAQPAASAPPFPPAPPAANLPQHELVGQWLQQQIERDATSPDLSWPDICAEPTSEPVEAPYTPPSFLLDDDLHASTPSTHESFASLTEPPDFGMPLTAENRVAGESDVTAHDLGVSDFPHASDAAIHSLVPRHVTSSISEPANDFTEEIHHLTPAMPVSVQPTTATGCISPVELTGLLPEHPPPQAPATPANALSTNAAWLLGIEPIPSLGDPSTPLYPEPTNVFTDAPGTQPVFTTALFQGASLPDEIEVGPPAPLPPSNPPVPAPPAPAATIPNLPPPTPVPHLVPAFPAPSLSGNDLGDVANWNQAPPSFSAENPFFTSHLPAAVFETTGKKPLPFSTQSDKPPPLHAETIVEIPVQLAAPGEASFDPPPLGLAHDFWQPVSECSSAETHTFASDPSSQPSPPSPLVAGPIIEAEIVPQPRPQLQNTVTLKTKPLAPVSVKPIPHAPPAETSPHEDPVRPPREKRPPWRSWWRGD